MTALVRVGNSLTVVYGSYEFWPSQCYWIVPGCHSDGVSFYDTIASDFVVDTWVARAALTCPPPHRLPAG